MYHAKPHVFADGTRLPFRDASMDAIVCLEVIEHVRDPEQLLAEIHRVLKPGGRALMSMPFLYPVHDAPHDYQRLTRYGWRRSLEQNGFTAFDVRTDDHAVRTAAMLAALAIAGGVSQLSTVQRLLLMPVALPLITSINMLGWLGGWLWPDWDALKHGYVINARKM
jgi:SAM-dependent methyltransferase